MPTYEYECQKCGNIFEVFHRMSDKPADECPKCKGTVKKLISGGAGLIFKGTGFYITDYKKKNSVSHETKEKKPDPARKTENSKDKPAADIAKTEPKK